MSEEKNWRIPARNELRAPGWEYRWILETDTAKAEWTPIHPSCYGTKQNDSVEYRAPVEAQTPQRLPPIGNDMRHYPTCEFRRPVQKWDKTIKPNAAAAPQEEAKKNDADKPRFDLVPKAYVEAAARALTFGAGKYSEKNYLANGGLKEERVIAALLRHTYAHLDGELLDPESGLQHLDHLAASLAMLLDIRAKKK